MEQAIRALEESYEASSGERGVGDVLTTRSPYPTPGKRYGLKKNLKALEREGRNSRLTLRQKPDPREKRT